MKWAYGVTTVPERRMTLLPQTLLSLAATGFDSPRLFVDGNIGPWPEFNHLETTFRFPRVRTQGNWHLALLELFIRSPNAERYAIFQDDLVTYKNLRRYLEHAPYPERGYCNLYTFPSNQILAKEDGWFKGRELTSGPPGFQTGRGAVALVFNREAVMALLGSRHFVERPLDPFRGDRSVDGGIVTALNKEGFSEYCHNPSLVQHTGDETTMLRQVGFAVNSTPHKKATSFRGEEFDAMVLVADRPGAS